MPEVLTGHRGVTEKRGQVQPRQEQQSQQALLPIAEKRSELMDAIRSYDTVVLKAGTGSGKSVIAPLVFLEALQKDNPGKRVKMLVAEPRQMLAESISTRAAKLSGVPLGGDLIGFYHGDSHKFSPETQIVYTVNGSLRKRIEEDKTLKEYDAVFLDEIHLRDSDQETILIGLKEVQKARAKQGRKPLKIIIASANVDQKYADYYGNAVFKEIEGQEPIHHVDKRFADKATDPDNIPIEMGRLAAKLIQDPTHYGDLVGFLPGRREIQIAKAEFDRIMREQGLSNKYKSASLTGGGGEENKALQKKLGDDNPDRDPVVAFATDVAEAGATFVRLTKVIDSGLLRTMVYDQDTGLESLETRNHAMSHYIQRLGRLGRTGNGEFYAMYSEAELNNPGIHPKEALPSILKEDLTPLVLSLKAMGITDVYNVDYIDHPGKEKLDLAIQTLRLLGAVNADGTLSDEGEAMLELPLDPHIARMMVEAKKQGCVEAASVLAGFLNSTKSVFAYNPRGEDFNKKYAAYIHPDSDYLTLLNVWNAYIAVPVGERTMWAMQHGFSPSVLHDVVVEHEDLLQEDFFKGTQRAKKSEPIDIDSQNSAITKSIIAGFADRILAGGQNNTFILESAKRGGIILDQKSVFAKNPPAVGELLISGAIRVQEGGRIYAAMNHKITREALYEVVPQLKEIQVAKEHLEREQHAAVKEAERIVNDASHRDQPIHRVETLHHEQAVAKKEETFVQKIKHVFADIVDRIKKLLRIK